MGRRNNDFLAERVTFSFDHAQVSATTTKKLWKVPAGRTFVLDRVSYQNPTGLVADPTNTFRGEIKKAATVSSLVFNTDNNDATPGAALVAATWVEGTPSATAADLWFAAGDSVDLTLTLEGTQTLPAGNGIVEGRLF